LNFPYYCFAIAVAKKITMKKRHALLFIGLLTAAISLTGQHPNFVRENYLKSEYQVEMRDGVKLHTIVYTPKDTSKTYPILMQRTPLLHRSLRRKNAEKAFLQ
jgi:predicted acyl esterase